MPKKMNTTLDKKHKSYLDRFVNEQNSKETLKNKLKEFELNLNKINKINFKDYTNEIIKNKAELKTNIKKIKKKINLIENSRNEIDYFNNSIDYLSSYYNKTEDIQKNKNMEIIDFFINYKKINKKNKNTKSNLLKKYLISIENISIPMSKKKKFKPKFCSEIGCKNIELILYLSEGYVICPKCGICDEILMDSDKPNYKEPLPDSSVYAYKRLNHLNEWLAQFQAKESTDIPDDVYEKILLEIKKEKLINKRLKPKKMRDILKRLELNKYYEHIQHIINKVTGVPPPKITKQIEEKLRWMFKEMQEPFILFCPKTRKNFLNYSFTLHKCFQLLDLDDFLPCFPLLKSNEKLKEQDYLWKKICNHLRWQFIPSI